MLVQHPTLYYFMLVANSGPDLGDVKGSGRDENVVAPVRRSLALNRSHVLHPHLAVLSAYLIFVHFGTPPHYLVQ